MGILVGTVPNVSVMGKLMEGGWYAHPKLLEVGKSVLARDSYTCQGCGFKSHPQTEAPFGYMIPASLRHAGFLPVNVSSSKTYCPFCISSMGINWSVKSVNLGALSLPAPGMLIALEEMTQVEINRLAICVNGILNGRKIGQQSGDKEVAAATSINNAMKARQSNLAATVSAYRIEKDAEFANALALLPLELYAHRGTVINGLRWWPNVEYWKEAGAFWGSNNLV